MTFLFLNKWWCKNMKNRKQNKNKIKQIETKKKQTQRKDLENKKQQISKLYNGVCFVCNSKFSKYFVFHHKKYYSNELMYRDFKSSVQYNEYILNIIKKRPNDFALLCKKHHHTVEILKRFSPYRFERVVRLVRESR